MRLLLYFIPLLILSIFNVPAQAQTTADGETGLMRGFARAVAISGGTVFIGEPANFHQPGVVYLYNKNGNNWEEVQQLKASNGKIGNNFGAALSADGNIMLVSAPGANNDNGAVYVYRRGNGNWSEESILTIQAEEAGFGSSVLLNGDHAYVGSPGHADGTGAVVIFRNENGSWNEIETVANPDSTGSGFGVSLDIDGNNLVVGAPAREGGNAYLFHDDGSGWNHVSTLSSSGVGDRSLFGAFVKIKDDLVFVSAPQAVAAAGAVVVFEKNSEDGEWAERNRLMAFDGERRYLFGSSIVFHENSVWIGAQNADGGRGAIYQFEQDEDGNWAGVTKLMSDQGDGERFAGTLAVQENTAVAGLTGADFGAGAAAIMEQNNTGEWITRKILIGKGGDVLEPVTGKRVKCRRGEANIYPCENVNLLAFLPIREIGGDRGVRLNDIWGWTDEDTEKNYALVGRNEGTSFVDVTDPLNPVYVGNLPLTSTAQPSTWRDIKIYKNHAYVVADNAREHGMQVLDLTQLREFNGEPITFEETTIYRNINSAHNIVINEETGFAYAVGSSGGGETCGGGLHMINIQDPANPEFAGCFADPSTGRAGTGYSHDAQCVIYDGPDEEHQGKEICIGSNETAISIADVTDKDNPIALSTASYPDHAYVHQGWLTGDQRYFFQNDELDELNGTVDSTRTIVWDVSDLDDPLFVREYFVDNPASDHNLYILGDTMYQSNYVSGLQVIDISNPEEPKRVGYFDTHPFVEDAAGFSGTWSNYPYFDDIVIMTSSNEGLFILDAGRD